MTIIVKKAEKLIKEHRRTIEDWNNKHKNALERKFLRNLDDMEQVTIKNAGEIAIRQLLLKKTHDEELGN